MRVVVISEGNTDVHIGLHDIVRGVIGVFVQRLLAEVMGVGEDQIQIDGRRLPRLHRGGGFARKVELAISQYDSHCDGLVIVVDRGGEQNRDRIHILEDGRSRCANALAQRTALGVAIEEMEAWLLADTAALAAVLGATGAAPNPERLSDPKAHLTKLAETTELSVAEYYDLLARGANIAAVAPTCRAFEDFAKEVKGRIARN